MEFNFTIILGIIALITILILITIIIALFSRKKFSLGPQEHRIEHDKKFKIKSILNDGFSAIFEKDHKRGIYNYNFAKSIYKTLKSRDSKIEKEFHELHEMLQKHRR